MSRLTALLVLLVALSSICFAEEVMPPMVTAFRQNAINPSLITVFDPLCWQVLSKHQNVVGKNIAKELYQEAFRLSFNGDWQRAEIISRCAAHITTGCDHWKIEANDLIR